MKDIRQSPQYTKYLQSTGWKVEKIDNTYIYLKKIPLLGWYAKIQRPNTLSSNIIEVIQKKYNPFQFSIEPGVCSRHPEFVEGIKNLNFYDKVGYFISNSPSLPTKTLQIDLTKSQNQLLKEMHPKTRYNVRLSEKKGLEIKKNTNIHEFAKLKGNFLSQKKNIIMLYNAFDKNAHLLCAYKNNKLLAGILLLTTKDTAYYMHAASTAEGNKLFAPTLLTWHTIQFAKKKRFKIYDFDGIYDERFPIKSWLGFTRFKKGFGGKELEYPGCFVKAKSLRQLFH